MARPTKQGLEYFSLDVVLDDKFSIIEAQHGLVGFAIVIKMLQKIYQEGYYYEWGEMQQILFSKSVSVDRNIVTSIVADCIKWKLFDAHLYEKHRILTSKGIQWRFVQATYKRVNVEMISEYLLIDVSDRKNITCISVSDIRNEETSIVSDNKSTQSKVKESKVNKSKVKESNPPSPNSQKKLQLIVDHITKEINPNIGSFDIELIKIWTEEHSFEIIMEAIKETALNKVTSIKYTDAILRNWKKQNIRNLVDLESYKSKRTPKGRTAFEASEPEWLEQHEQYRDQVQDETQPVDVNQLENLLKSFKNKEG